MLDHRTRCNYRGRCERCELGSGMGSVGAVDTSLSHCPGQNLNDENLCNIFAKLTIKHAPNSGLRPAIKLKTRGSRTKDGRSRDYNMVGERLK